MSVRALMDTCSRCFRCRYEMPSGPVVEVCLVRSIADLVMFGVKGGGGALCSVESFVRCMVRES